VNVTFTNMDGYGNIMLAGWGSKVPYGFNNAFKIGYLALIDQYGLPYWVYQARDNINSGDTVCTYISHVTIGSTDFVYGLCNLPRWDLNYVNANYLNSPVIIKLLLSSGNLQYMAHLPVDGANNMLQNGLFATAETSGANTIAYAIYRYRYSNGATTQVQNFAAVSFNEATLVVQNMNIYFNPDPTAGGLLAQAGAKTTGWYST
jgi:hypothetical protein